MDDLRALEEQLFNDYSAASVSGRAPIFIVGAPRTGSTTLYLLMIKRFGLGYFANLVNDHFAATPAVGVMVHMANDLRHHLEVTLDNRYGHTVGPFQPSEGTRIFNNWFGAGQPAETKSARPGLEAERHMSRTFSFLYNALPSRLVFKNVWNSFRLPYLAEAFPPARFVWMRRRTVDAALSDLSARYVIQTTPTRWNAAMPANVEELARLPYAAQVVENQRAFTGAIGTALAGIERARWTEVWYHDLIDHPDTILERLGGWLDLDLSAAWNIANCAKVGARPPPPLPEGDERAVRRYAAQYPEKEFA